MVVTIAIIILSLLLSLLLSGNVPYWVFTWHKCSNTSYYISNSTKNLKVQSNHISHKDTIIKVSIDSEISKCHVQTCRDFYMRLRVAYKCIIVRQWFSRPYSCWSKRDLHAVLTFHVSCRSERVTLAIPTVVCLAWHLSLWLRASNLDDDLVSA